MFGILLLSGFVFAQANDSSTLQTGQQATVNTGLTELKQEINKELRSLREQATQTNAGNNGSLDSDDRIARVEKQLARINQLLESQPTAPSEAAANNEQTELVSARTQIEANQQRIAELEQLLEQKITQDQQGEQQAAISTNAAAFPIENQAGSSPWKLLGIAAAVLFGGFLLLRTPQRQHEEDYYDELALPETQMGDASSQAQAAYVKDAPLGNLQAQIDPPKPFFPTNRTDPVAIAAAHLAANQKPKAIEILENALLKQPNQGLVASRLLYLYRSIGDIKAFSNLYRTSIAVLQQEPDWAKISTMATAYFVQHGIQLDTQDEQEQDQNGSAPERDEPILDALILNDPVDNEPDLPLDQNAEPQAPEVAAELNSTIDNEPDLGLGQNKEADTAGVSAEQISTEDDLTDFSDSIILMLDESLDSDVTTDPAALLSQAKQYITSGDKDIAKAFLNDVITADNENLAAEAQVLIASL